MQTGENTNMLQQRVRHRLLPRHWERLCVTGQRYLDVSTVCFTGAQSLRWILLQQLHHSNTRVSHNFSYILYWRATFGHYCVGTFLMRSRASIVRYGGKLSLHFKILSMVFFLFSAVKGGWKTITGTLWSVTEKDKQTAGNLGLLTASAQI